MATRWEARSRWSLSRVARGIFKRRATATYVESAPRSPSSAARCAAWSRRRRSISTRRKPGRFSRYSTALLAISASPVRRAIAPATSASRRAGAKNSVSSAWDTSIQVRTLVWNASCGTNRATQRLASTTMKFIAAPLKQHLLPKHPSASAARSQPPGGPGPPRRVQFLRR